jgi:hypothetical protein
MADVLKIVMRLEQEDGHRHQRGLIQRHAQM